MPVFLPRSSLFGAIVLGVSAVLAAGCASRVPLEPAAAAGAPRANRLAAQDHVFAMQAAGGGLYEVEVGRLAVARATRPEVRAFGQMLVDHHTASHLELAALLHSRGLVPPATLPSAMALRLSRLAALSGEAFDRQFVQTAGIDDHQAQIGLAEQAVRDARDPALRAWFARVLPTLRGHLGAARSLQASMAG